MRVSICGKRWNLRFVPLRDVHGDCEHPNKTGKTIRIDSRIKDEKLLEILLHETHHAGDWHRDEDHVRQLAADQARILWALGYRRTNG